MCFYKQTGAKKDDELSLGPGPGTKIGRSKTMSKKEIKKRFIPRTETDALWIGPGPCNLEVSGLATNDYQFAKQLGQKSYATTYKGVGKKTKEERVVTVIKKNATMQLEEKELFVKQKIYHDLMHANIAKIYEFHADHVYHYIATEFIAGTDLFDEIVKRKVITELDVGYIVKQLISAISYSHSQGIMHGDIKPANLLVKSGKENGQINIKITGFATTLFISPQTRLKETVNLPYFTAPEIFEGKYAEKSDVWSIGVILYILLTGSPPFDGVAEDEIMNSIKKGALKDNALEHVSDPAKDLVRKMLTVASENRITAMEASSHPFLQCAESRAIDAAGLIADLNKFNASLKLQNVTISYIASQLTTKKERQMLKEIFAPLDQNASGTLLGEDILDGYSRLYCSKERASAEVNDLINSLSVGHIIYTEFLETWASKKQQLSLNAVKHAFDSMEAPIALGEVKKIVELAKRFSTVPLELPGKDVVSYEEFVMLIEKLL